MSHFNIEKLLTIESKIIDKHVVFFMTATGKDFTELRMLEFIHDFEYVLKALTIDKITRACFVFNLNGMKIPSSFCLVKEFSDMFDPYLVVIKKKISYSVIVNENNLFSIFFAIFKQYYKPQRPLYYCKTTNEMTKILSNKELRDQQPNLNEQIRDKTVSEMTELLNN